MLAGPLATPLGWQALWMLNGIVAMAYAGVVWIATRSESAPPPSTAIAPAAMLAIVAMPEPRLLALAFGIYTFQYYALTGLLPALLVERMGLTIAQAGAVGALTVVANALGNLAAGLLQRWAIPLWAIVASAFGCMGAASLGVFSDALPVAVVAGITAASLAITGLIPASIFIATPKLLPQAPVLTLTFGLLMQASNIGQVLGPAALGLWAHHIGWSSAPVLFGLVALGGIAVAMSLRRLLHRPPPGGAAASSARVMRRGG
jgi:predicted MFS family arabinose efflux permease